ncbi:MAG: hypothetical protein GYA36_22225 [Veillonellaceae bacterium]|nr:hypothetical protein [Veillonellaceae bacterium]
MKKLLFGCLILFCLLPSGCVKPTPAATATTLPPSPTTLQRFPTPTVTLTPSPVPIPRDETYQLNGVFFVVPACLDAAPALTLIDAVLPNPNAGPLMYYPAHRQVSFTSYPLKDKFFEPLIRVYPVKEFAAMSDISAGRVSRMTELLASQTWKPGDSIPLLPGYSMMQIFQAQVKFLDFKNGRGVRWLTELAPYSAPVNNQDLFYSYQGMTSDGKYWVSVMLPVNAAYLQDNPESVDVPAAGLAFPSAVSTIRQQELESYYTLMLRMLNNTPDAAFTPALDCLDKLVASIAIGD